MQPTKGPKLKKSIVTQNFKNNNTIQSNSSDNNGSNSNYEDNTDTGENMQL